MAQRMDKVALIRSVHHEHTSHNSGMYWATAGRPYRIDSTLINPSRTDLPGVGTLVGWLAQRDGFSRGVPPYVITPFPHCDSKAYITPGQYGGCLGARFDPFVLDADPNAKDFKVRNLSLEQGLTMADSVNGRFPVIRTLDGETWQDIGNNLPDPLPGGEFAFAASGTCVATVGKRWAWISTGSTTTEARILATTDQGETWNAYPTPIASNATGAAGVFSVDFRNPTHGVIGGGDFIGTEVVENFARSKDGGKTWELATNAPIVGAIFGLSYVGSNGNGNGGGRPKTVVATGPAGAAWTPDEGDTWHSLDGVENYWAVAFASPDAGWLVGTDGRILKVSF